MCLYAKPQICVIDVSLCPTMRFCATYNEEDSEHGEADQLKGLATNEVECSDSEPVSWNSSGANQDAVTGGNVVELVIYGRATAVANGLEDGSLVESKAVECDLSMQY